MTLPFVGLTPRTATVATGIRATIPVPPVTGINTTNAAQTAAFVAQAEPLVEALLADVRARSSGEVFYPDGKVPCPCGPESDNPDIAKTVSFDPNWCVRKDGPATAPVIRKSVSCGELPTLFWPDIFEQAKALLVGYLQNPPAQSADAIVQTKWTERVLELCTVMASATNVSPEVFCAFTVNPVGPSFVPRVKLELVDQWATGASAGTQRKRIWVTRASDESLGLPDSVIQQATRYAVPRMTTAKLPPLPSLVAAMWAPPGQPPGDRNTWFGGLYAGRGTYGVDDPAADSYGYGPIWDNTPDVPGSPHAGEAPTMPTFSNQWSDDALQPAFFKGLALTRGALPEWVCDNNRTVQWMRGDMQPLRTGWHKRDGVLFWPSDMMGGADPKAYIQALRGNGHGTFDQLGSLFVAMRGEWWKPGWAFYNEWYLDTSGFAGILGRREQYGPGFVPGAWFYMTQAYHWGQWFAGLDYSTVVNSALYFYASNYLPGLVSRYSLAGVNIATPDAVRAIQQQVSQMFAVMSRQAGSTRVAVTGLLASVATALAGTGAGVIAGIFLAIVSQLYDAFQKLADDNNAAFLVERLPIYSPLIRVPVDATCPVDASAGAGALAASVPALAAPAANAMIAAFVQTLQQTQQHPDLRDLPPAPTPGNGLVYAVGGGVAVAALLVVVLALRGKR